MDSRQMLAQLNRGQFMRILEDLKCSNDPTYSGICGALNKDKEHRAAYEAVRAAVERGVSHEHVSKVVLWENDDGGHDVEMEWM